MSLRGRLLLIRTHSNHNGGRSLFFLERSKRFIFPAEKRRLRFEFSGKSPLSDLNR